MLVLSKATSSKQRHSILTVVSCRMSSVLFNRNHTIIQAAFVCLFVCLFVPYVLRGPLTDLRQTWWVYVRWPPICPWGVLFRKGQRVDGSTGHFRFPLCYICGRLTPHHCKKHTAYDSRQHQTHATPLTKAHGIFCSLETGNFLVHFVWSIRTLCFVFLAL